MRNSAQIWPGPKGIKKAEGDHPRGLIAFEDPTPSACKAIDKYLGPVKH